MTRYAPQMVVESDVGTVRITNVMTTQGGEQYALVGEILDGTFAGKWATIDIRDDDGWPPVLGIVS